MTNGYVVDSGVVVRWYVDQVGHVHARELQQEFLSGALHLRAPDVLRWEVVNVLRKKGLLAGLLAEADLLAVVASLEAWGLGDPSPDAAGLALVTQLAVRHGITLFDAAFVALALQTGLPLLTTDTRLARSVGGLVSTEVLRGVTG